MYLHVLVYTCVCVCGSHYSTFFKLPCLIPLYVATLLPLPGCCPALTPPLHGQPSTRLLPPSTNNPHPTSPSCHWPASLAASGILMQVLLPPCSLSALLDPIFGFSLRRKEESPINYFCQSVVLKHKSYHISPQLKTTQRFLSTHVLEPYCFLGPYGFHERWCLVPVYLLDSVFCPLFSYSLNSGATNFFFFFFDFKTCQMFLH